MDGLKGFPEAFEAHYPKTEVQMYIGHLVRVSLNYVPWKYRKLVAEDRAIYLSGGSGAASPLASDLALFSGLSYWLARRSGYADFFFAEELFWSTRSLRRAISSARCSP